LLEIIYLWTLSHTNNYIICKFGKIDHAEAWKILDWKPSGIFQ